MAAQPALEAAILAALLIHSRVRRSTPVFGRKEMDTVTLLVLLAKMGKATPIAGWNMGERICAEFYMTLRDKALIWWDSLDNCVNVDKNMWADVQREFIAAHAPRFTARTTFTTFQELMQRQGENIHDSYLRVTESFRRVCDAKPNTIEDITANKPNGMEDTDEARAQLGTRRKVLWI